MPLIQWFNVTLCIKWGCVCILLQFLDLNEVSGVVDTNGYSLHEQSAIDNR